MKLVDNQVSIYTSTYDLDGVYKSIRDAAAICYQTDTAKSTKSPKEFMYDVLLKNGHTRPLEFGTVYLKVSEYERDFVAVVEKYYRNKYSRVNMVGDTAYITTNMRVICQGSYKTDQEAWEHNYDRKWMSDVEKYLCPPSIHHDERLTFRMILSRGCMDDLRTHIELSSIGESTRYCNYANNKFGKELTFIRPYWGDDEEIIEKYKEDEETYIKLMESGRYVPQQLKRILPMGIKSELCMCGYMDAWDNFIWRRADEHADPECVHIAQQIRHLIYE